MLTNDWKLDERGERLALRIDAMQTTDAVQGVKFAMARGVRSAFIRSRGCMIRLAAGEITGAWCFRPQNAKVTFADARTKYDAGFFTEPEVRVANVYRQPNNKTAVQAFELLLEEIERRVEAMWSERGENTTEARDLATEAASDLMLAKHREELSR